MASSFIKMYLHLLGKDGNQWTFVHKFSFPRLIDRIQFTFYPQLSFSQSMYCSVISVPECTVLQQYNNLHVTMKSIYYTSKHSQAILPKFPTTELVGEESSALSTVIGGLRRLCKYSTSSNSTTKMKMNETTSGYLLVTWNTMLIANRPFVSLKFYSIQTEYLFLSQLQCNSICLHFALSALKSLSKL